MTTHQYQTLLGYAKFCLSAKKADLTLTPHDLVADAYCQLGETDVGALKKWIRGQILTEQSKAHSFARYGLSDFNTHQASECSRICKVCGLDLGMDSFYVTRGRAGRIFHYHTCKICQAKRNYQKIKANPEKYANALRQSELYRQRTLADPKKRTHLLDSKRKQQLRAKERKLTPPTPAVERE